MNLASRDYQEKRSFIRMRVETPVTIQTEYGTELQGTCHNLSGGGMLISLGEPLPVGCQVEALVSSNHGHNPMLKAMVQVERVETHLAANSRPCHMGVSIMALID